MHLITILLIVFCQSALASSKNTPFQKDIAKLKLMSELSTKDNITRKEAVTFKFEFFDTSAKKKSKIQLKTIPEVKLWMIMEPGMEHGSEELNIKAKDGAFIISNAWFLMMGEWQLKAKITHNDIVVEEIFPICVERKAEDSYIGNCK